MLIRRTRSPKVRTNDWGMQDARCRRREHGEHLSWSRYDELSHDQTRANGANRIRPAWAVSRFGDPATRQALPSARHRQEPPAHDMVRRPPSGPQSRHGRPRCSNRPYAPMRRLPGKAWRHDGHARRPSRRLEGRPVQQEQPGCSSGRLQSSGLQASRLTEMICGPDARKRFQTARQAPPPKAAGQRLTV